MLGLLFGNIFYKTLEPNTTVHNRSRRSNCIKLLKLRVGRSDTSVESWFNLPHIYWIWMWLLSVDNHDGVSKSSQKLCHKSNLHFAMWLLHRANVHTIINHVYYQFIYTALSVSIVFQLCFVTVGQFHVISTSSPWSISILLVDPGGKIAFRTLIGYLK